MLAKDVFGSCGSALSEALNPLGGRSNVSDRRLAIWILDPLVRAYDIDEFEIAN
jgi:hypothetical protein